MMRHLGQYTDAVTGFSLCVLSGTMLQMFYNFQSIIHDHVAFLTMYIDDSANTAVVMLKIAVIQSGFFVFHTDFLLAFL